MAFTVAIRGGAVSGAGTNVEIYPTPGNANTLKAAAVFISLANGTGAAITCDVWNDEGGGGTVTAGEMELENFSLPADDRLVIGPISCVAGDKIMMTCSAVGVTGRYNGFESA